MGEKLQWAVKNGDLDAVKALVEQPGFQIDSELLNGRNALHYAADYGQAEVIKYLVKKGAKLDLPDKHGITALLAAVYEDHEECVRVLVSSGASKNGKAPDGSSYLDCAEGDEVKALLK